MQTVRTTISLPTRLFEEAKIRLAQERLSLSRVVREALQEKLTKKTFPGKKMPGLGRFRLGIKDTLSRRDLYLEHVQRSLPA